MLTGGRVVGSAPHAVANVLAHQSSPRRLCASSTARQMVEYLENRCDCGGTRDDTAIRRRSLAVPNLKNRNLELRSAIQIATVKRTLGVGGRRRSN